MKNALLPPTNDKVDGHYITGEQFNSNYSNFHDEDEEGVYA